MSFRDDIRYMRGHDSEAASYLCDILDGLVMDNHLAVVDLGLPYKQATIFSVLHNNRGRVATRDALIAVTSRTMEEADRATDRNIDSLVKKIRKRLVKEGRDQEFAIETVYGLGFRMRKGVPE